MIVDKPPRHNQCRNGWARTFRSSSFSSSSASGFSSLTGLRSSADGDFWQSGSDFRRFLPAQTVAGQATHVTGLGDPADDVIGPMVNKPVRVRVVQAKGALRFRGHRTRRLTSKKPVLTTFWALMFALRCAAHGSPPRRAKTRARRGPRAFGRVVRNLFFLSRHLFLSAQARPRKRAGLLPAVPPRAGLKP